MPLLHVTDRPDDLDNAVGWRRPGLGAAASGASHVAAALVILAVLRMAPAGVVQQTMDTLDTQRMVWIPSTVDGGGRAGGGNQSTTPARRAQSSGREAITVPSAPAQTTSATVEPPPEMLAIQARPMGDSAQMLVGTVASDSTTSAMGPGNGPGGNGDGDTLGAGRRGPNGIGDGLRAGSPGVTTPIVVQQVRPQYTADAMRAKVQGSVWLECVVLTDGSVGEVRVTRSLDPAFGLDQEAIAAARRWRFKPGTMHGKPVPVMVSIELTFSLR